MSEDRDRTILEEENSFFDNEYKQYLGSNPADSCATGSITLNDLTGIYGTENTRMLKDYQTGSTRITDISKAIRDNTDHVITELAGKEAEEVRSDYEFDADELTVAELITINEEILRKQTELSETPREPYLSNLIAAYPGEETERIAVISVPETSIAYDESPFISIDEIIDHE